MDSSLFQYNYSFHDYFSFTVGRVNGLRTRESKRRRIENCSSECSQLVVNMLRPVDESETLQC